ncbi:translation elongation factor Ts, partial [Candidatus Ishikawella capsulata]|uniref:Elongation factor Ts n=1 Tax=Candidatus Ishikawaella capsulata Mpkobe TaxID=476281 RepID=C5WCK8_9ENTR
MNNVSASLIKELRELTGSGIMECKKALLQSNGNIEIAIDNMRKAGKTQVAKKSIRIAKEGCILIEVKDNKGIMIEINCETDFVSRDEIFLTFCKEVLHTANKQNILSIEVLQQKYEDKLSLLMSQFKENIVIRRMVFLQEDHIGFYIHGSRIGVLISAINAKPNFIKQIAMHIAASKPDYISNKDIPAKIIEREYQIQRELVLQKNKSIEIENKIIEGKMKKFTDEISLVNQKFIFDNTKTVGHILREEQATVKKFFRFELGEAI